MEATVFSIFIFDFSKTENGESTENTVACLKEMENEVVALQEMQATVEKEMRSVQGSFFFFLFLYLKGILYLELLN